MLALGWLYLFSVQFKRAVSIPRTSTVVISMTAMPDRWLKLTFGQGNGTNIVQGV